jgi:hypothetical protein
LRRAALVRRLNVVTISDCCRGVVVPVDHGLGGSNRGGTGRGRSIIGNEGRLAHGGVAVEFGTFFFAALLGGTTTDPGDSCTSENDYSNHD